MIKLFSIRKAWGRFSVCLFCSQRNKEIRALECLRETNCCYKALKTSGVQTKSGVFKGIARAKPHLKPLGARHHSRMVSCWNITSHVSERQNEGPQWLFIISGTRHLNLLYQKLGTVTLKGFKPMFNLIGSIRSFIALHHWDYCVKYLSLV